MTLDPVSTGDPHVPVHNAERTAINALQVDVAKKINKPNSPALGTLLRWDGDNYVPTAMRLFEGAGSPEGVVSAPVGSRYIDSAATGGVAEYFKASGTGNTGWLSLATGIGWTNVSLGSGWSHTSGNPGQYSSMNGVTYLRGSLRRTSGTGTTMASIPTEYAPLINIPCVVRAPSDEAMLFGINANGTLTISAGVVSAQDIPLGSITGAPFRR